MSWSPRAQIKAGQFAQCEAQVGVPVRVHRKPADRCHALAHHPLDGGNFMRRAWVHESPPDPAMTTTRKSPRDAGNSRGLGFLNGDTNYGQFNAISKGSK